MNTLLTCLGFTFNVELMDDGTLDTVLEVTDGDGDKQTVRFSQEEAAEHRDEDGCLTDAGFIRLAEQAVDLVWD